jgi:hypothetical protein
VVEVWQVPVPLHSRGCTRVAAVLQLPATHWVPLAYRRQPPDPLQVPSLPQVAIAACGHWVATAGAPPAGTSEQSPTLPASAHDWQVPLQSRSQQTPCAHTVELHSAPMVQTSPLAFLPHTVPLHELGARQSAAEVAGVHDVLQLAAPSHRKGSQAAGFTVRQ